MSLHAKAIMSQTKAGYTTKVIAEAYTNEAGHFLSVEAIKTKPTFTGPVVIDQAILSTEHSTQDNLLDAFDRGVQEAITMRFTLDFYQDYTTPEGRQASMRVFIQ